ncbi:hypothetical protein LCGC14_1134190 [marine sediment metagenome]|uniref:Uncharacterized protein n=1 Tax=marine sediment metagenome TaxID=412755 RepID=A0A0F9M556_9ZZZZ
MKTKEQYKQELAEYQTTIKRISKERKQISIALKLKGILGEEIAPINYILAEIERLQKKVTK